MYTGYIGVYIYICILIYIYICIGHPGSRSICIYLLHRSSFNWRLIHPTTLTEVRPGVLRLPRRLWTLDPPALPSLPRVAREEQQLGRERGG